jgi:hypothetical protein
MTIPISNALKAAMALGSQTLCTLLRVDLTNGTILGFTDHDSAITYNDGDGSLTYNAAVGYSRKDVPGGLDLAVDTTDYDGILTSPNITEADLKAGVWDYATVRLYLVNFADLTMGHLFLRKGHLGQVTVDRGTFTAEVRGMMQAYARTIGELTSATCRAELYDARCKVNPGASGGTGPGSPFPFTVTGTLTGVSASQMVLYDTSRTEPGPTGGVSITAISQTNPGHVTLADGSTFFNAEAVTLSGITGPGLMPTLNANTIIRNLSGNVFDLGISTVGYGTYSGGGMCTPLGEDSGWFDFGLITFTSGNNNGLSGEVLSYVPGQWTLEIPFPYTIQVGDTYTMLAGCDKSLGTCKDKFSNVVNMRAEPYLPGVDKIVQVGKQPSS